MDNSDEIKIRTIPRSNETKKPEDKKKPQPRKRMIIYVGIAALALGAFTFFSKGPHRPKGAQKAKAHSETDLASYTSRTNDSVSRHMQDAEIQREIMRKTRELENAPFKGSLKDMSDEDLATMPEDHRAYGVQMDNDESVDRVLEDINGDSGKYSASESPADKINARIANRKWVNDMERAEKVAFLSNFIRSAYDKGYEVVIDSNLVVVDVKRLNHNKVLDINQVIDRLAKTGH